MNQPDLKAFVLGEQSAAERRQTEAWLQTQPQAVLETERLAAVLAALRQAPDEEPPRRIAFVSDKIFESSWWQRVWRPAAVALGASAMLSAAIVTHGLLVSRQSPAAAVPAAALSEQAIARRVDAAVAARLDRAVTEAVLRVRAEAEADRQRVVAAALRSAEEKFALERQADRAAVEATIDTLRKQIVRAAYLASNREPGDLR